MAEVPVLSWCLVVRNASALLDQCLASVRERTPNAEIVVVDTMSRDNTLEIARKYADILVQWAGPKGTWTPEDPWVDDMASAREYAFSLASGRWRAWIDHDDRLPAPAEVERLLRLNGRWEPRAARVEGAGAVIGLEELLVQIERDHPEADVIWCPYLYQRDKDDAAIVWQERERIVRWTSPPRWRWAEKAHEILVPVAGYLPAVRIDLPHLLFLHEREFSLASMNYAVSRHFDVLLRQYNAHERTTRRCLYLAAYAPVLAPEREEEFITAGHAASTSLIDRYRALMAMGSLRARQGLYLDALENYGAATHVRADLPDAWIAGAETWREAGDLHRAIEWLDRGLGCPAGAIESGVAPRHHAIRYKVLLADMLQAHAAQLVRSAAHGTQLAALQAWACAEMRLAEVAGDAMIGPDHGEALARWARTRNAHKAQGMALAIADMCQFLCDNDEPLKALGVLKQAPWMLQDHPVLLAWARKLRETAVHVHSTVAYHEFYADHEATGFVASPAQWLELATCLPRAKWMASHIGKLPAGTAVFVVPLAARLTVERP